MDAGRRKNHKDLILRQKATALAAEVPRLTAAPPRSSAFVTTPYPLVTTPFSQKGHTLGTMITVAMPTRMLSGVPKRM